MYFLDYNLFLCFILLLLKEGCVLNEYDHLMGYNFINFKAFIKSVVYLKICFPGGASSKELAC